VSGLLQILGITPNWRWGIAITVVLLALPAMFYFTLWFVMARNTKPMDPPVSPELLGEARLVIHEPAKFVSSHAYNVPDQLIQLRQSIGIQWQDGTVDYRGILNNWYWSLRMLFDSGTEMMTERYLREFLQHLIAFIRGMEEVNRAVCSCLKRATLRESEKRNYSDYVAVYNDWLGRFEDLLRRLNVGTEQGPWRFSRLPSLADVLAGVPPR
jgi:hypothetical protein